jgi:CheY-like chemotaxis protein
MCVDDKTLLRKASILLVDDEPSNLVALRAILEGAGDALVEAASGEDALRRVLAQDFAVIILDVQMRGMDGFETARLLRRCERSQSTPIIFVTAFDSPNQQIGEAYSLGAVDFLVKPLVPTILRAKVDVFVELFRKTERIRQLERDEFQHQLAIANSRRQQTAHAVAKIAAEFTSETDAVRRVLQTICDNLAWDAGALWEPSEDGRTLRCAEFWQRAPAPSPDFEATSRERTFNLGVGLPGRVWANKQTVWVPRLLDDGNFPRLDVAAKERIRAAIAFPVVSGDDFLGVMEFFSGHVREPD